MKHDKSRLRQQILNAEASRQDHVQGILQEQGPLRSGSLVNIKRTCGKANCRCVTGQGHPTTYLSCKENGRTRMVYIPAAVAPAIAREAQRYRRLRQHRASLAKLAHQSLELVDKLQEALQTSGPIMSAKCPTADTKRTPRRRRR